MFRRVSVCLTVVWYTILRPADRVNNKIMNMHLVSKQEEEEGGKKAQSFTKGWMEIRTMCNIAYTYSTTA